MANTGKITDLTQISPIDRTADLLEIVDVSLNASHNTTVNAALGITGNPIGDTDTQTLANKTLTAPTINGATFSGTLSGTYTIGGTVTFPSSVVTLTGSQTLTNKILTSPTINTPTITNASITQDSVVGFTSSNTGTVYGITVTSSQIASSNSVLPAALVTGIPTTKLFNTAKFRVYLTAAQSSINGTTLVNFDTKTFDTSSNFSTSTHLFTAVSAGSYYFSAGVADSGSPTTFWQASLFINGALATFGVSTTSSSGGSTVADLYTLNVGDTVGVHIGSGGATAMQLGTTQTYFSGFLVSAT